MGATLFQGPHFHFNFLLNRVDVCGESHGKTASPRRPAPASCYSPARVPLWPCVCVCVCVREGRVLVSLHGDGIKHGSRLLRQLQVNNTTNMFIDPKRDDPAAPRSPSVTGQGSVLFQHWKRATSRTTSRNPLVPVQNLFTVVSMRFPLLSQSL